jgi:hypothetical protein
VITQEQLEEAARDMCPRIGSGGYHTDSFYDDGCCQACGFKPRPGVTYPRDPYADSAEVEFERVISDTAARRYRLREERRSLTIADKYDLGGEA